MGFIDSIAKELNNETKLTENGAVAYRTSGKKLLDLNFAVASLRRASEKEIINKFMDAYWENPKVAMRWLFYCRDCRCGLGERRTFRVILKHLGNEHTKMIERLIPLIAEYGREDDLWCLLETPCKESVLDYCAEKLNADIKVMRDNDYGRKLQFISRKSSV
jgi:hypothetical protein